MKSVVDNYQLDQLLRSQHSYMPAQRAALAAVSFKDSAADIAMNVSAFTDNNDRAYDAIIPGIFGTLSKQVLTVIIKNEKDLRGFFEAFWDKFMGAVCSWPA